ncbi:hypothetical protein [Sulfurimonas sp.]|uniref:hypothetical protein n=1 Tax=Sulfurimonas sp. TaxID=2022749 RepID=UPI003D12FE0E
MDKDYEYTKEYLKGKLNIGTKIKIGRKYAEENTHFKEGQIIELIEGEFYYDNGLYEETQCTPSIWDEKARDFDSIYHLFENDLSGFLDCRIV